MKKSYLRFLISASIFAVLAILVSCDQATKKDEQTVKLNFTVLNKEGGTLSAKIGEDAPTTTSPLKVKKGQEITFTASPNDGYEVEKWEGVKDIDDSGNTAKLKIEKVDADINVSVKFKSRENTFSVSFDSSNKKLGIIIAKYKENGTPLVSPANVEKNKVIVFEASPEVNGEFVSWEGIEPLADDPLKAELTVTKDTSIKAIFRSRTEQSYEIKFSVVNAEGGKLEAVEKGKTEKLSSPAKLAYGATVVFTAEANPNFKVKSWQGIVVDPPDATSHEFYVSRNIEVKVEFGDAGTSPSIDNEALVNLNPPAEGIIGQNESTVVPYNSQTKKGVFIEGRTVKLDPYQIGKYEVSYNLWKKVFDWAKDNGYSFANEGSHGGTGETPVVGVNWRDCVIWCNAYTEMKKGNTDECVYRKSASDDTVLKNATNGEADTTFANMKKKGFRLPTEAEWEFAARYQGDGTNEAHKENAYLYGTNVYLTKLDSASGAKKPIGFKGVVYNGAEVQKGDAAWEEFKTELLRVAVYGVFYNGEKRLSDPSAPKAVQVCGSKTGNMQGIHDMSGNAYEWCFDWYTESLKTGEETNPVGPETSEYGKVFRGGSIVSFLHTDALVGDRQCCEYYNETDSSLPPGIGFRFACTK